MQKEDIGNNKIDELYKFLNDSSHGRIFGQEMDSRIEENSKQCISLLLLLVIQYVL